MLGGIPGESVVLQCSLCSLVGYLSDPIPGSLTPCWNQRSYLTNPKFVPTSKSPMGGFAADWGADIAGFLPSPSSDLLAVVRKRSGKAGADSSSSGSSASTFVAQLWERGAAAPCCEVEMGWASIVCPDSDEKLGVAAPAGEEDRRHRCHEHEQRREQRRNITANRKGQPITVKRIARCKTCKTSRQCGVRGHLWWAVLAPGRVESSSRVRG